MTALIQGATREDPETLVVLLSPFAPHLAEAQDCPGGVCCGGDLAESDHYAACMDEAAIEKKGIAPLEPLLDVIDEVDGPKAAARALMELHAAGVSAFFAIDPTQDYADATQVIGYLDQRGLGLPDRDYYLEDTGNMKAVRQTYREHVGRMFVLLGAKPAEARVAAADVLRLETALARRQQDKIARRDPRKIFHRIDRAGLEKIAPGFPWGDYLQHLGIGGVTAIAVNQPAYYTDVTKLLASERPLALRRYLQIRVAHSWAPELGKAFVDEDQTLERALSGREQVPPRARRCFRRVDGDLPHLLGKAFVALRFAGESKARAIDLTKAVLEEMARHLGTLPWMDAPTRAAAKETAKRMAYLVQGRCGARTSGGDGFCSRLVEWGGMIVSYETFPKGVDGEASVQGLAGGHVPVAPLGLALHMGPLGRMLRAYPQQRPPSSTSCATRSSRSSSTGWRGFRRPRGS